MNYYKKQLKDKYALLWLSVDRHLEKYDREFKNKYSALFSKIQKDVNNQLKQDISNISFLDLEKYAETFANIYYDMVSKVFSFTQRRVKGEIGEEIYNDLFSNEVILQLKKEYIVKYLNEISSYVLRTTIKDVNSIINRYNKSELSKEETLKEINDYFNNHCKKYRAKLISITENRRIHNVLYFSMMVIANYKWKIFIANPNTDCLVCKELNGKKFFMFDIIKDKFIVPPIHPQNTAIILMIKGE